MVTTFVRSVGSRTQGVWKFLEEASQLEGDVRLAELQHSSFKKLFANCSGRVPICVHPSFYGSLEVRFPLDVGGLSRGGRVAAGLGTGDWNAILDPKVDGRGLDGWRGVGAA